LFINTKVDKRQLYNRSKMKNETKTGLREKVDVTILLSWREHEDLC